MKIQKRTYERDKSVVITLWDKEGRVTKRGKKSITFTIEGTSMDELADFIKNSIKLKSEIKR